MDLGQRYFVRTNEIASCKGSWSRLEVSVFRKEAESEEKIGEYLRSYSSFFNTFVPFSAGGKELALYSKDYTCTRIMELPSCKDIGGEEPQSNGFCPTDYHVPCYRKVTYPDIEVHMVGDECFQDPGKGTQGPLQYCDFGFIAGCVWGDDTSWKIQFLDLAKAAEGVLVRDERFGYIHLPRSMKLKDAIDMGAWEPGHEWVGITHTKHWNYRTREAG